MQLALASSHPEITKGGNACESQHPTHGITPSLSAHATAHIFSSTLNRHIMDCCTMQQPPIRFLQNWLQCPFRGLLIHLQADRNNYCPILFRHTTTNWKRIVTSRSTLQHLWLAEWSCRPKEMSTKIGLSNCTETVIQITRLLWQAIYKSAKARVTNTYLNHGSKKKSLEYQGSNMCYIVASTLQETIGNTRWDYFNS